jgi:hypothetical protein
MTIPIRSFLVQLLVESINRQMNDDAFGILLLILTKHDNISEHIHAFFELLHISLEFSPELQPKFAAAILQAPSLALHQDPSEHLSLLGLLSRGESAFAVDFLLFHVKHANARSIDENAEYLTVFFFNGVRWIFGDWQFGRVARTEGDLEVSSITFAILFDLCLF